jgi:2-keto-4-pentenoate hydratase/2-oxohepta-3-ene-1,7-dioic acid hydratase in catechol pathway
VRLLTYQTTAGPAAAIQLEDTFVPARAVDAPASSVRGLLEAVDGDGLRELAARAEDAGGRIPLAGATLCAPVVDAHKIICIGLNYRENDRPGRCGLSEALQ